MAKLSRDATCECEIYMGRFGPELQILVRLPEPRLEDEGMKVVIVDEEIQLADEILLSGVMVKPSMTLSISAEIPTLKQSGVKKRRALEAARVGSPILH